MMCMAGRLVPGLFVFILFVSLLVKDATAIFVYDRLTLINIKTNVDIQFEQERGRPCSPLPPVLSEVPPALCRLPWPLLPKKR